MLKQIHSILGVWITGGATLPSSFLVEVKTLSKITGGWGPSSMHVLHLPSGCIVSKFILHSYLLFQQLQGLTLKNNILSCSDKLVGCAKSLIGHKSCKLCLSQDVLHRHMLEKTIYASTTTFSPSCGHIYQMLKRCCTSWTCGPLPIHERKNNRVFEHKYPSSHDTKLYSWILNEADLPLCELWVTMPVQSGGLRLQPKRNRTKWWYHLVQVWTRMCESVFSVSQFWLFAGFTDLSGMSNVFFRAFANDFERFWKLPCCVRFLRALHEDQFPKLLGISDFENKTEY